MPSPRTAPRAGLLAPVSLVLPLVVGPLVPAAAEAGAERFRILYAERVAIDGLPTSRARGRRVVG